MIVITEDLPTQITFENTRSGDTFRASLREGTEEWAIVPYGTSRSQLQPVTWGHVELRDGTWYGFAGTIPQIEPRQFRERDAALEWVTNDS